MFILKRVQEKTNRNAFFFSKLSVFPPLTSVVLFVVHLGESMLAMKIPPKFGVRDIRTFLAVKKKYLLSSDG